MQPSMALGGQQQEEKLPNLRDDLSLHQGPRERDGSPTWTLQDPSRNRFFRIGWAEFEILCRWSLEEPLKVVESVNQETTLNIDLEHVQQLSQFLAFNNLTLSQGPQAMQALKRRHLIGKKEWWKSLLHNYLFFKIPVVRPDRFLTKTVSWVAFAYSKRFFMFLMFLAVFGLYLIIRQWDQFIQTFIYFFNFEGILYYGLALILAKIIHEMGHAYTAKRYGVRVPTMGIAFLVLWPVLYTDTTDAWKLPNKFQRLYIGGAGMIAELMLAVVATFLWSFTDDGPVNSALFLLATVTWIMTLFVNLNPCMRFDGYYLLSDLLDVQNLQDRSFALGKWRLRKTLFGFNDPVPEKFPPHLQKILIIYSYATWIYRFFLFLGIALLVYHFFFKVLGVFLMVVELLWFIFFPIGREIKQWIERRQDMKINRNTIITLSIASCIFLMLVVPWRSGLSAPALLKYQDYQRIIPQIAGQIKKIHVQNGDAIQKGDLLFEMVSPELGNEIQKKKLEIESLRWKLSRQASDEETLEQKSVIEEELATAQSELVGLEKKFKKLRITAPFNGVISDLNPKLKIGQWHNDTDPLAILIDKTQIIVEAFVSEKNLLRIMNSKEGYFRSENLSISDIDLEVIKITETNILSLDEPYLASVHGGDIAVNEDKKEQKLVPNEAIYLVLLKPSENIKIPEKITRGAVIIYGEGESYLYKLYRVVASVLIRESGF